MKTNLDRFKPGVDKDVLLFLAGLMWIGAGIVLLSFSFSWLRLEHAGVSAVSGGAGFVLALVIHHFGFLRVVDKNLGRILPMEGKRCVFSFLTWKSYVLIAVMMTMGIMLRHSPLPKRYLSVVYTGIGLALVLSSIRYLRVLHMQKRKG